MTPTLLCNRPSMLQNLLHLPIKNFKLFKIYGDGPEHKVLELICKRRDCLPQKRHKWGGGKGIYSLINSHLNCKCCNAACCAVRLQQTPNAEKPRDQLQRLWMLRSERRTEAEVEEISKLQKETPAEMKACLPDRQAGGVTARWQRRSPAFQTSPVQVWHEPPQCAHSFTVKCSLPLNVSMVHFRLLNVKNLPLWETKIKSE